MTLTQFLLARIAEDEAAARDAYYDGQAWIPEEEAVVAADRDLEPVLLLDRKCDAAHAYRWSPARVLAECEAKRRIVELSWHHLGDDDYAWGMEEAKRQILTWGMEEAKRQILTLLALPYADHPDYRNEWKP